MSETEVFLTDVLTQAGDIVMAGFRKTVAATIKEDQSNVLTETDIQSEHAIVSRISSQFPHDAVIAEESGYTEGASDTVWIVDPIDGTSNFASGIPWFGIMVAKLVAWKAVAAAVFLPASGEMYFAEKGSGATCNGTPVQVTAEKDLKNLLFGYQIDYAEDPGKTRQELAVIELLVQKGRNLRTTNSCVDFCLLASGHIGAVGNQAAKIWDIAPLSLLVQEAGGVVTDILGQPLEFRSTASTYLRNFTSLSAPPQIHTQLSPMIRAIAQRV